MKRLLLAIAISTLLFGCVKDETKQVSGNLLIRVQNGSGYPFSEILVNTSGGEQQFGALPPSGVSAYKAFSQAYRYAFVELKIGGDTFTIQPIDYVGETPLSNGQYTYYLQANDSSDQYGRLSMSLIED